MGRTACTQPQCLYKGAIYIFFTLKVSEIPSQAITTECYRIFWDNTIHCAHCVTPFLCNIVQKLLCFPDASKLTDRLCHCRESARGEMKEAWAHTVYEGIHAEGTRKVEKLINL